MTHVAEPENLGGRGGLSPSLFGKGGLNSPKLEVVTKNVLNANSLFRMNENNPHFMNAKPPHF